MSVHVTPCTPVISVETPNNVIPRTPILSVETFLYMLMRESLHVLLQESLHVLLQESMHILLCDYFSMHMLPRSSVHMILQTLVLVVYAPCVCLSLFPTHSCEATLAMVLGKLMSKSGVISGIYCIMSRNIRNVDTWNGLVNKYANISPVGQYFSEKSPLSIQYLINKYCTQMWFFCFVLDIFPLFSMIISLMLSWCNYISYTV